MSQHISGGCACGRVRYESDGEVEFAFHCHCRKCQRATGAGHASAFALDGTAVRLTGEIKYFEQPSDAGYMTQSGFCPDCGSPVLSKTARAADRLYFHAATLDDPASFQPRFVVYEEAAQPWDHVDAKLAKAGE